MKKCVDLKKMVFVYNHTKKIEKIYNLRNQLYKFNIFIMKQ